MQKLLNGWIGARAGGAVDAGAAAWATIGAAMATGPAGDDHPVAMR